MKKPMLGEMVDWTDPLNQGLVLYLRMNEGMGNVVRDLSLNGNHGKLYSMTHPGTKTSGWTPGFRGKTLAFDGANDYVDCGDDASLDIVNELTVSAWIKTQTNAGSQVIIRKEYFPNCYNMYISGANIRLYYTISGVWGGISTPLGSLNTWHYVVITREHSGTTATLRIYIDGIEQTQISRVGYADSTTGSLIVGQDGNNAAFLNGSIDDVRIYNRALTQSEITRLYMEGMPSKSTSRTFPRYFVFDCATTAPAETFALPLEASGDYDFEVHWGDGSWDTITAHDDAAVTHTYASAGTHTVTIEGKIKGWRFDNAGDCAKMRDIKSWGCLQLGNNESYFYGCAGLTVSATDILDLTGTTTLKRAFHTCSVITTIPSMNSWNVSSVTDMFGLFTNCLVFNQDIGSWDVSSITDMQYSFYNCRAFNQDIGSWDVSSVATMYSMFFSSVTFNQDISGWDVSSIANMGYMFNGALNFDQDIGGWDIQQLTNALGMFLNVTLSTANYDALLIGWEAQIEQANVPFHGGNSQYSSHEAVAARAALVANGWTITDGGTTAPFVFEAATTAPAETFALPLEASGVYDFNVDWGDGSDDDITVWNHADVTHTYASAGTHTITINGTIKGFRFNNAGDCSKVRDISAWGCLLLGNSNAYFYGCTGLTVSATDVLNLVGTTNMNSTFRNCSALTSLDVSLWDVSSVTTMYTTFYGCSALTALDVSSWDISSVTDLEHIFNGCSSLTALDVSSWDTSSVNDLGYVFSGCSGLATLDVSSWDTGLVVNMPHTFNGCVLLTTVAVSGWNITSMTDAASMFNGVTLTTPTYDALLIGWEAQNEQLNVVFDAGNSKYTGGGAAEAARDNLTSVLHSAWTITDGGVA